MRLIGPAVIGIRRWSKEWMPLAMDLAQDRRAWSAAVRDAVNAMDADRLPSRGTEAQSLSAFKECLDN